MKVSVLTPDLSHNCLGRAWVLAQLLKNEYDVEIVGPVYGKGIWKPMENIKDIPLVELQRPTSKNRSKFKTDVKEKVDGDIIYASKPLYTSYGVGLLAKRMHKVPLLLDIDDWQMGFLKGMTQHLNFIKFPIYLLRQLSSYYNPSNYWNSYVHERKSSHADAITVSNNFLKEKFGGTLIPHCRDPKELDPKNYSGEEIRKKYKLQNKKVVSFIGTPNRYKGIEDIIEALALLDNKNLYFLLVGMKDTPYNNHIKDLATKRLGDRFVPLPLQPFSLLPELLAASDIAVIPQRESLETVGQIPAKVFDAMLMKKAIVATAVNDMPIILDGVGWVVQPNNIIELKEAIEDVLNSPDKAKELGEKARERCIKEYSFSTFEKKLIPIVKKLV